VSGDFPVQLATRFPDWSAGGLLRCSVARLSVCRVVLQIPRARHARILADILARMLQGKCSRRISALQWTGIIKNVIMPPPYCRGRGGAKSSAAIRPLVRLPVRLSILLSVPFARWLTVCPRSTAIGEGNIDTSLSSPKIAI